MLSIEFLCKKSLRKNQNSTKSQDNSYQATTHIKRPLISNIEIENSYQVLTFANLQSINSSLKERLSQFDHTLVAFNTFTPNER